MKIEYVGPKPIISHRGIEFDTNKDDKYIYLNIVVQLIKALSHDYFEDKTYHYDADTQRMNDDEIIRELRKICPDLDSLMKHENHDIEEEIEHNIQRANESDTLTDEDKEVLKTNIDLMHDYIVQRSINKSVYYCSVHALTELLKKDRINYIIAPMFQTFAHVFHSVQGVLKDQKYPIDSQLDIYQKNGKLVVKLQVINTNK